MVLIGIRGLTPVVVLCLGRGLFVLGRRNVRGMSAEGAGPVYAMRRVKNLK